MGPRSGKAVGLVGLNLRICRERQWFMNKAILVTLRRPRLACPESAYQ